MRAVKRFAAPSWRKPSAAGGEPLKRRDGSSSPGKIGITADCEEKRPTALRVPVWDKV